MFCFVQLLNKRNHRDYLRTHRSHDVITEPATQGPCADGIKNNPPHHVRFAARARNIRSASSANIKRHPQVLSDHYGEICPPETAEAFRIAEANVETLHAREYDTNAKADKLALGKARWELKSMIVCPVLIVRAK